jgi:hypothetical protein
MSVSRSVLFFSDRSENSHRLLAELGEEFNEKLLLKLRRDRDA